MQPYFFPYLGYFQLINKTESFLAYGHVDFSRRSYVTRNFIIDRKLRIEAINLRVKKAPLGTKIIHINKTDDQCQNLLLRKVTNTYSRAKYFDEVIPLLKPIIKYETNSLMDYNTSTIESLCKLLNIQTDFISYDDFNHDFIKIEESLGKSADKNFDIKTQRITLLCQFFKKNTYINSEGGIDLYSKKKINQHDIILKFHRANLSYHRPKTDTKMRYSSIIDVLMINGLEKTKEMVRMGDFF